MKKPLTIPVSAAQIYPNPIQYLNGTPVVVFRDHRWVLPVIFSAAEQGVLTPPVRIVTFDRHRDFLKPEDRGRILTGLRSKKYSFRRLVNCVKYHLSPRDDDWIIAGMELDLISDVFQFGSECDEADTVECFTDYEDSGGLRHRAFHLERPGRELSFKGALADSDHAAVKAGLWDSLLWNPVTHIIKDGGSDFILDIDLDFFTISWERYTLPFTGELYTGEFLKSCSSGYHDDYTPLEFISMLASKARIVTMATEPQFCDGAEKSRTILNDSNRYLFGDSLDASQICVDYTPVYPSE